MKLSVVLSVYNGADDVARTLDSILAQTERDFELIVVDDGSTDATPSILADYAARDSRIRVIAQDNQGLTRALIRGCAAAQTPILARHDCGDVSLPQRFEKQLAALSDPGVILASCWVRSVGPEGEPLFIAQGDGEAIENSLRDDDVHHIRSIPHHGTAMFRRADYESAGGYRDAFRFAQDLDLWMRLVRAGRVVVIPEVLYEAKFSVTSISASRRKEQVTLATIAIAHRDGGPDSLLDRAREVGQGSAPASKNEAPALYFIASCLRRNGDMRYKRYARAAIRRNPLHLRAWLLLLR